MKRLLARLLPSRLAWWLGLEPRREVALRCGTCDGHDPSCGLCHGTGAFRVDLPERSIDLVRHAGQLVEADLERGRSDG